MAAVEEVLAAFPRERIDADNLGHFTGVLERRLLLNRCNACGLWHQPPQPLCPRCWSTDVAPTEVSGRGTVHLVIHVHQGPGIDPQHPYPVAVVELDEQEGLRVTTTLVDCPKSEMVVGLPVSLTWIERDGAPAPAFRPRTEEG